MEKIMDDVDRTDEINQPLINAAHADAHRKAEEQAKIPHIEGECDVCVDESKRLVLVNHPKDGIVWACARCRDKHKLPLSK